MLIVTALDKHTGEPIGHHSYMSIMEDCPLARRLALQRAAREWPGATLEESFTDEHNNFAPRNLSCTDC